MLPLPTNETERLAALRDLRILDTPPEAHFDAVCRTAAALFFAPIAFVSLVDSDRQWFKAKCGIAQAHTPRDIAFCAYAILSDDVLVVEDATADPRFSDNPMVTGELGIRFYAGAPLVLQSGIRVGTICIMDTTPRGFSNLQTSQLQDLAKIVVAHIELHHAQLSIEAALEERARSEARIAASEARLALALDSGSDGLWDWNVTTGQVWYSDRWQTMLGYESGEIEQSIGSWERLTHPDDLIHARALLTDHLGGRTASYSCEHRVRTKSGGYTWVLSRGRVVSKDDKGAPLRVVGTYIDITERKVSEQRIAHLARHDVLTGLPNRAVFHEHLEQRLAEIRCGRGQLGLLCLDLDRFKSVNDTLGHPAGDDLLCKIAARLTATVRGGDVVVRLGGDEFAIIVSHLDHAQQASLLAQRVIDAVGQPLDLGGVLVTVGVSIGIALAPANGDSPPILLRNADLALYRAKESAGNTYRFYEAGMDEAVEARMQLELEMREAVICGSFALHYQPVLRLADDRIIGFEALMRWPHATRGMIAPDEFIPLAEETGLIVPLGTWALQEACREAASWPHDLRIAVNVSAIQFQQPGLEQSVMSALAESGLPPHRLELEITESVLVQDAEAVIACLHRLRDLGVRIALDDFGTGYSSLSYLRRFPFDKIKIDRSFISEISDPDAAAIVRAVVGIAMHLGASVTAEGVETIAQFQQVRQEGCCEIQGYLVSKPLSAVQARSFLQNCDVKFAA